MPTTRPFVYTFACFTAVVFAPMNSARAWGDEGHKTIALIAEHYLTPAAKAQVDALLAADTLNTLTEHDIASEATWPDKYREHGGAAKTSLWHYADIEVSTGDVAAACFEFPKLSEGQLASDGPAKDCVIDKINEFEAELANPATPPAEKVLALKYLLHFVGDVHQPLHSADENDRGGNDKLISGKFSQSKKLHAFWDTNVVQAMGPDAATISTTLINQITPAQITAWAAGSPKDWALEAFKLAKDDVYEQLPAAGSDGKYDLSESYLDMAEPIAATQLSRAGVGLAYLLNRAFTS